MVAPVCPTNERLNSRRRRNGKGFPPHRAGWPVPPSRADRRRPGASRGARAGRATSEDRREPRVAQHSSPLNEVRGARGVPPWVCRHAAEMKCRELGRQFVPAGRDWRSPAPASWRRGAAGDGPTDAPGNRSACRRLLALQRPRRRAEAGRRRPLPHRSDQGRSRTMVVSISWPNSSSTAPSPRGWGSAPQVLLEHSDSARIRSGACIGTLDRLEDVTRRPPGLAGR
jgi:hypothetical protein